MRKITILLVVGLLLLSLTACGGGNNDNEVNGEDKDAIEVDKNLSNVEITIPASMIADEDPEEVKAEAEQEEGIDQVTINSDGSLTYKMTKAAHKRMMDDMKEKLEETLGEIANSSDFPSIKEIKANKSFSEFTMVVEREKFENSFDGFAALSLGMLSMYYQVFDGADPDTMQTIINVKDFNTGEIFNTYVYPDDLN